MSIHSVLLLSLLCLAVGFGPAPASAQGEATSQPVVHWLDVADVIGPISAQYMTEAILTAEDEGAAALVFQLDTPGGLMTSTRIIIKAILGSSVPICVYVGPEGAHAASAGTFILYAAHVAGMAEGTNIGAASPVAGNGAAMDSTMAKKVFEDAEAQIRSLAQLRGRNEEWAVQAVREAKALSATDAETKGIVDWVAGSREEVVLFMDGRVVTVQGNDDYVIHTQGARIEVKELTWRFRALSLLNNPTVAYLLLMLGFYGLFFELSNPGAIFPGVVGAICMVLGLLGLQTLSLNYAGLLLLILALILFFLEIQIASYGLLSVGGAIAMLAGSLMLFDSPAPFLRVSTKVVLPVVGVTVAFFVFAVTLALRAQRKAVVSGKEQLLGLVGDVRRRLDPEGAVFVAGEHWSAVTQSGSTIEAGASVRVVGVDNLRLTVRPEPTSPQGES